MAKTYRPETMRAFIAIEASNEVRTAIGALIPELESRVAKARWIPPENLHLTLRFLGRTDERLLGKLSDELRSIAAECVPFHLEFRGIGLFPSPRRPRVLSVLIPEPPRELAALQRGIEATAVEHGFAPESRAFKPHLTLARLRGPAGGLRDIQAELAGRELGRAYVNEVTVFESVLKRSGAVYQARARLPLGGTRRS